MTSQNETALTCERLKQVLDYNPGTDVFTWTKRKGSNADAGSVAGYNLSAHGVTA